MCRTAPVGTATESDPNHNHRVVCSQPPRTYKSSKANNPEGGGLWTA